MNGEIDVDMVKVAIFAQPLPRGNGYTTRDGTPFEVPKSVRPEDFPAELKGLFSEYNSDLHYPPPNDGSLSFWKNQGVFLSHAVEGPSGYSTSNSLSRFWDKNSHRSREIVRRLSERGIVFCLMGSVARRLLECISLSNNEVILTPLPTSPNFKGTRLFSTINAKLVSHALEPVDWMLP